MFWKEHEQLFVKILLGIALVGIALLIFRENTFKNTVVQLEQHLASTTQSFTQRLIILTEEKQVLQDDNDVLTDALRREKRRSEELEEQIGDITKTVDELERLSKIDTELLQKYSKVFFLNEHYTPEKLSSIPKKYLYLEDKEQQIHQEVLPFLKDMLNEAEEDDVPIYIVSAFRSFDTQVILKGQYAITYGVGTANQFSADQGYSEHQLGTAVDFTTTGLNGGLDGFDTTPAYEWLQKNAYKYGFILSYPHNNAYYQFESWHWRFVGIQLARKLYRSKIFFYDMEQREIDTYLGDIFE